MDRKWWKIYFEVTFSQELWLSPHFLAMALLMISGCIGKSVPHIIIRFSVLFAFTAVLAWLMTTHVIIRRRRKELRDEHNALLETHRRRMESLREEFEQLRLGEHIVQTMQAQSEPEPKEREPSPWLLGELQQHLEKK